MDATTLKRVDVKTINALLLVLLFVWRGGGMVRRQQRQAGGTYGSSNARGTRWVQWQCCAATYHRHSNAEMMNWRQVLCGARTAVEIKLNVENGH